MLGAVPCSPQHAKNICDAVQMQTQTASQEHPPTTSHSSHGPHGSTMNVSSFVNNGSKLKTHSLEPRPPFSSLHSCSTPCHANAGNTNAAKSCTSPNSSSQTPINSGRKHAPLNPLYQPSSRLLLHGSPTSLTSQLRHHIQPPTWLPPPPHQPQAPPAHSLNHSFTTEEVQRDQNNADPAPSKATPQRFFAIAKPCPLQTVRLAPPRPNLLIPCLHKLLSLAFSTGHVPAEC